VGRWLLARRSLRTGELAYYACAGPAGLPLVALVRVAGSRWRVEEAFQAGKGLCGLDQHQVRRWRCWYRWVTLAMLAYAFLVVAAVTEHTRHPPPLGLIPLTCNEIQHLFAALVAAPVADKVTGCAGRGGGADSRPAPVPATTAGKPPSSHEGHELRLGVLLLLLAFEDDVPVGTACMRRIGPTPPRSSGRTSNHPSAAPGWVKRCSTG